MSILTDALKVVIDHEQTRIIEDRNRVIVKAAERGDFDPYVPGWDISKSTNVTFDPITFSGILTPMALRDEWLTQSAGIYARLRKTDFTLTGASWEEKKILNDGDYWLVAQNIYEAISTVSTYGVNRGIYFAYHPHTAAGERFEQMRVGWSNSATLSSGLGVSIWSDGTAYVYYNGSIVGEYKISGGRASSSVSGTRPVRLFLIPGRFRELLVFSDQGDGFNHVFPDLNAETTPITGDVKMWCQSPNAKAEIQLCPLSYSTTGTLISRTVSFARAPKLGAEEPSGKIWWDPSYATFPITDTFVTQALVEDDTLTTFVADGEKTKCRVAYSLTSTGTHTPFVYASTNGWPTATELTDGTEQVELTNYLNPMIPEQYLNTIIEGELEVDETGVAVFHLISKNPNYDDNNVELDPVIIHGWGTTYNRPMKVSLGDERLIIDGSHEPFQKTQGLIRAYDRYDITIGDPWRQLDNYMFREIVILSGSTFQGAVETILNIAGLEHIPVIMEVVDTYLDAAVAPSNGEFGLVVEVGDRAGDWLRRLFDDYAASWLYTFKPIAGGYEFRAGSEEWWGSEATVKLWARGHEAREALKLEFPELNDHTAGVVQRYRVYARYDEDTLEPEANEIFVTGWDPMRQELIQAHYVDEESQDVSKLPSTLRDVDLREIRYYGLVDTSINSKALTEACVEELKKKLIRSWYVGEWDCDLLFTSDGTLVWHGDCVELDGKGIYRVRSFRCRFTVEPNPDFPDRALTTVREATYIGDFIGQAV